VISHVGDCCFTGINPSLLVPKHINCVAKLLAPSVFPSIETR